ncbi:MAG TPA: hypothetical protein VKB52_01960 [Rhodanobacteraceae bacterium]|nr:hypothetical protein [Rhodanobacteraceae bacterium]
MKPYFMLATLLCAGILRAELSADTASAVATLSGRFDNKAQVASAPTSDASIPHVTITIEPTSRPGWSLWHVHLETDPETSYDQTWAMEARTEYDGSGALIPYYQFKQETVPTAASFGPEGWLSLEACALRGPFTKSRVEGASEGEPCVAVSMGVGARRALLPVGFLHEGNRLQVDLNLRGVRTRIDATAGGGDS